MRAREVFPPLLLLLLLCSLGAAWNKEKEEEKPCKYTRRETVEYAAVYFDTNNDNMLSRSEVQDAWNKLLTPIEKNLVGAAGYLGWVETVDTVMKNCDHDRDGVISLQDFINSKDTCLSKCWKIETLFDKVLTRAFKLVSPDAQPFYDRRMKRTSAGLDRLLKKMNLQSV